VVSIRVPSLINEQGAPIILKYYSSVSLYLSFSMYCTWEEF
jgi:hypothetical protein